jgi:hypothetical protein
VGGGWVGWVRGKPPLFVKTPPLFSKETQAEEGVEGESAPWSWKTCELFKLRRKVKWGEGARDDSRCGPAFGGDWIQHLGW